MALRSAKYGYFGKNARMTSYEISHDENAHQFGTTVDGCACELDYRLANRVMTITHTCVPQRLEGRGIAAEMTRVALETARARRWKVVAACSYAAAYLGRHPEYSDLTR